LLEPLLLFGVLKQLDNKRNAIEKIFIFIGQIDSLLSIASLRKGLNYYCIPSIVNERKEFAAKDVYHPLIKDCVENSIAAVNKSVLLTGSNMSGKTSFIKTIGINVITGLTLNTCFSKEFNMPKLRVYTAIRINDDLMNDKSYYFEEVLTIKEMINNSVNGTNLFLLDEIFKGTNTVERVSAGKAVLRYLAEAGNIVFVSTHDIELADLLKDEYSLYHFSEKVDNNKTVNFDYKLKEGKLKKRNAIQILQINNYPDDVVNEAMDLSEELEKNYYSTFEVQNFNPDA
jgi:DNA mismatch repair ATPase MutS